MRKVSWFYEKVHDFTLCHYAMNQNFIQNAFRNFSNFLPIVLFSVPTMLVGC